MRTHLEYHIQPWDHHHEKIMDLSEQVKGCCSFCLLPLSHPPWVLSLPSMPFPQLSCTSLSFPGVLQLLSQSGHPSSTLSSWPPRSGKRIITVSKEDRVLQGPAAFATRIQKDVWGKSCMQLIEKTAKQIACIMDFILYSFTGCRMYIKFCYCYRKSW